MPQYAAGQLVGPCEPESSNDPYLPGLRRGPAAALPVPRLGSMTHRAHCWALSPLAIVTSWSRSKGWLLSPASHRRPLTSPQTARAAAIMTTFQPPTEALRCLKRRISDAIYAALMAGARRAATSACPDSPGGQPGNLSVSRAAGSHPNAGSSGKPLPGPTPPYGQQAAGRGRQPTARQCRCLERIRVAAPAPHPTGTAARKRPPRNPPKPLDNKRVSFWAAPARGICVAVAAHNSQSGACHRVDRRAAT